MSVDPRGDALDPCRPSRQIRPDDSSVRRSCLVLPDRLLFVFVFDRSSSLKVNIREGKGRFRLEIDLGPMIYTHARIELNDHYFFIEILISSLWMIYYMVLSYKYEFYYDSVAKFLFYFLIDLNIFIFKFPSLKF